MRSFLLSVFIISLFTISNLNSQDIKAKLSGHLAENGFTVVDDNENALFRVDGAGNVAITRPGSFLTLKGLSVQGGFSDPLGRGIDLVAESGFMGGGNVFLSGGTGVGSGGQGGNVTIMGGNAPTGFGFGGDITIKSGVGSVGGDVNINTGSDGNYNETTGSIIIKTASNNNSGATSRAGGITLSTGNFNAMSSFSSNSIKLKTGSNNAGGGDIILEVDASRTYSGFGNIKLTPHTGGGQVVITGSGTFTGTWTQASDERFKSEIEPLHNSLDKIQLLSGVSYQFRKSEFPEKNFADGKQIGLIAQDVEKIFPEFVQTDNEGYKSVSYQNMVAVLIEAVKEQQKSIDELKKEIEILKSNETIEVSTNTESNN